jgi:hypothetical protein
MFQSELVIWESFVRAKFLGGAENGFVGDTGSISLHQCYATDSACDVERVRMFHLEEGKDYGK